MGNRVSRITDAISRRKRKETGQDPVEGCVDLEDRFYNNDSFKRGAEANVSTPVAETPMEAHSTKDEAPPEPVICSEELEVAATKIQAGFKGYKTRKEVKELKGENNGKAAVDTKAQGDAEAPEEVIQLESPQGVVQPESSQQVIQPETPQEVTQPEAPPEATNETDNNNEEEVIDIDLNDPEVADAAAKIQAGFRAHKTRRTLSKQSIEPEQSVDKDANNSAIKEDDVIDIDLTDPEVSAAATKIQANFRGHHTRQKLRDTPKVIPSSSTAEVHREPVVKEEVKTEPEIDIDLTDPEVEAAAQKIQASFRGHMKLKRKQTTSQEENQEKARENQVDKDSSALPVEDSGVPKRDKEVSEENKKEDVTEMKPAEQSAEKLKESEGDQVNKNVEEEEEKTTAEGAEGKKTEVPTEVKAADTPKPTDEEEIDIDLNDPEVAAATKKLQAGFRGRLNRKKKAKEDALAATTPTMATGSSK